MSKKPENSKPTATASDLEALAVKLDGLMQDATALGEEKAAKRIGNAAKSCRHAHKQREARQKKVGDLIAKMQEQGMSAEQIVAKLTS